MSMYESNTNNNNTSGNGEYKEPKVNTKGHSLKNFSDPENPQVFEFSYYNDSISVKFYPELPKNLQTEKRKMDYNNAISTLLVPDKAAALYAAYVQQFIPAMEAGEEYSCSVIIADVNALRLCTGVDEYGKVSPYIQLLKGIDLDTAIPEVEVRYNFKSVDVINGYNPTKGTSSGKSVKFGELDLIMTAMKDFVVAIGKAQVHASRVVNKFMTDKVSGNIEKIAEKVGAEIQKNYKSGGASYRSNQSPLFSSVESESNVVPSTASQTYSSLSDLEI